MIRCRPEPPRSLTFVLRLWETRSLPPDPAATWRMSLQNIKTGKTLGFASLEELFDFLRREMGAGASQDSEPGKEKDTEL